MSSLPAPIFIGLDLAWSDRNRTGAAVIQHGRLQHATGTLTDNRTILAYVARHVPAHVPCVIAIDAPLCVPNQDGRRACDHAVSVEWARMQAGAYPANRRLLARGGVVRGEALAAALEQHYGCVQAAPVPRRGRGRYVCEVYPHPAHVALFELPRTLKYKRKPGRTHVAVAAEFRRYQTCLATLTGADPPLCGLGHWTAVDPATLRGRNLRELEEMLDAVTCAYVAWYAWWHGPSHQRVYGTIADGHILVPFPPGMAERLTIIEERT